MNSYKHLTKLSYSELNELVDRSSILEGFQAEAFSQALREVALYSSEPRLQVTHSQAILRRMESCRDFQEALLLSHLQESMPSFYLSLTLRHIFARGLVAAAKKNSNPRVHRRAINRLLELPGFSSCPVLQGCAGDLFLELIAECSNSSDAEAVLKEMKRLPGLAFSEELKAQYARAEKMARRAGRDPIVKIDLKQRMATPVLALKRLLGVGEFRLKVELRGLEAYEEAVVKVPAFTEEEARRVVNRFIADFLKEQAGTPDRSAKIIDVFPPGSAWESGAHPVLNLK